MTARRRIRLWALVLTLALVGLACSNESDDDTTAGGRTETTAGEEATGPFADLQRVEPPDPCTNDPGITDTEIEVGGLFPESGPRAVSFKPAEDGVRARFEKANQEGEVGPRKLVFKPVDDASDAARNAEAARQLVESEKVFGIVEVSDQSEGSARYLNEQGIPVTGWHVGRPPWSTYPNMFTFRLTTAANPDETYTTRNGDLLAQLGATKIALVGGGNQASASFINRVRRTLEARDDLEVVYTTTDVQSGNTEFTSVVQRIKESGADGMVTGMDFLQNTALSDQLKKAGVTLKAVLFPGGYDPRVTGLPGIEGAMFGLEFKPFELNTPSFQEFDKWLPKDVVRNQTVYVGWLSAELFIEGIKQAGVECPTRKAFITNLRLLEGYTANGAFDPIDFVSGWGKEFQCLYYVKVENGKFVPQFDGKQFCGKEFRFE